MRKDRTIISELQEFFLQNDAHLAINSISDELMESTINGNNHQKALFEPYLKGKMAS